MFNQTVNNNLVCEIDNSTEEKTVGFLKCLEDSLCLFSGSVNKLYADFKIHSVTSYKNKVIARPRLHTQSEIFHDIPCNAVKPTGVYLFVSEAANDNHSESLRLAYKSNKTGKIKSISLKKGMKLLQKKYRNKGEFLPVILNEDFKFKKSNKQIMQLHRVDINALYFSSDFEKRDITRTVESKLTTITY